jgi:hypothetical protein
MEKSFENASFEEKCTLLATKINEYRAELEKEEKIIKAIELLYPEVDMETKTNHIACLQEITQYKRLRKEIVHQDSLAAQQQSQKSLEENEAFVTRIWQDFKSLDALAPDKQA